MECSVFDFKCSKTLQQLFASKVAANLTMPISLSSLVGIHFSFAHSHLVCLFQSTSVILGLNRLNCCPNEYSTLAGISSLLDLPTFAVDCPPASFFIFKSEEPLLSFDGTHSSRSLLECALRTKQTQKIICHRWYICSNAIIPFVCCCHCCLSFLSSTYLSAFLE